MKEYIREYPLFSLCGLNCCLCPRYNTDGESKCPGCGGSDFQLKHPDCGVISCNRKHENVEFCFKCSLYPCQRYSNSGTADSFISYRNVLSDMEKVEKEGLDKYIEELNEKVGILEFLLDNYNDGRRKSFYCNAVNLMNLTDLKEIMSDINSQISNLDVDIKEKAKLVVSLFEEKARERDLDLKLRK